MEPKRDHVVVVSDVHISTGRSFMKDYHRHPYEWLDYEEAQRFLDFLRYLQRRDNVKELVLLGDIFETWLCPIDELPPTPDEVLLSELGEPILMELITLVRRCNIDVLYLPGNHDMDFFAKVMKKHAPHFKWVGYFFDDQNIHMEHGHLHSMFNCVDPLNDPDNLLPIGYYMSRLIASHKAKTGEPHNRDPWGYLDDLFEALGPSTLTECVWEAVLEDTLTPKKAEIVLPNASTITAEEVGTRYEDLFKQWIKTSGLGGVARAIMAETGHLGMIADRLCRKRPNTNIVVFGHSHRPCVDLDRWPIHDRIYANPGAWVGKHAHFLDIQVTKTRDSVRLYQWHNAQSRPKLIKKETLLRCK
jgi:UDP-2,3-diacylglucosamine pyrophosphatase LpxH